MVLSNIHAIEINSDTIIHLLSYAEYDVHAHTDSLTEIEKMRLKTFQHPTRQMEFVATRILRTAIFGKREILYSEIGAPFIADEKWISISHSNQMVGIAVSNYKIGFDLEPIRKKALKLKTKFLHAEESKKLNTDDALEMTIAWSLKESLYKLAGRKKIIFKDELRIEKENDYWRGTIHNPTHKIVAQMKTFHSGNNVLTINASPIEIK